MFYVYVLKSLKDGEFYTGFATDLKRRLKQHNSGSVTATKYRKPLKLVYYEACLVRRDALRREIYLKSSWGKRFLKSRMKYFLVKIKKENSPVSGGSPRGVAQGAPHGTPFDATGYQTGGD